MKNQYIYLKTHNVTGLKYLGKTYKDPFRYKGSGVYWLKHLKVHGNDVNTEVLRECETKEEVTYWGEYYSDMWDVVNNNKFANLQREVGDGRDPESVMGTKNPNYGKKWSDEQRKKLSEYRKQFVGSKNHMHGKKREDLSEYNRKPKRWVTNQKEDKLIMAETLQEYLDGGYVIGRTFANCKKKK